AELSLLAQTSGTHRLKALAYVYGAYQSRLDAAGLRDFRDLIADAIALLEARPDVLESLQREFLYLLVGEFQYVDPAQFHLLRTLAPPAKSPRLLVAGDADQSIYGFRGTVRRLLAHDFARVYGGPSIELEVSHRCPPSVLAVGRSLLAATQADARATPLPSGLPEPRAGGPSVRVAREATAVDEAFFVAREIRRLMLEDPDLRPGDFAVLLRSTTTLSAPFEEAIRALDLPYEVRGVGAIARNEVVRFLLTYLRAVHEPADPESLERVLGSGLSGVGHRAIEEGRAFAKVLRRLIYWLHGSDPEAWPLPWGEPDGQTDASPPKAPDFAEFLSPEELRALHAAVSAYYEVVRRSRRLPLAAL